MAESDTPHDIARATLLAWREENKRAAPSHWLSIARRIATHPGMAQAWKELAKRGIQPMPVFAYVSSALEAAAKETRRQTATEERRGVERVIRLAGELKAAIEESPLPANWVAGAAMTLGTGKKAIYLDVGWRDLHDFSEGAFGGLTRAVSICEVLSVAEALAQRHLDSLVPRAVARHRGKGTRPAVTAFVRWLAYRFGHEFGSELRGVIARITTALFDDSPLAKRDVDVILKDRPRAFVPPKRRSREP